MFESGHEDQFPPLMLSARSRFSQQTFAGVRGNLADPPEPSLARCRQLGADAGRPSAPNSWTGAIRSVRKWR
jgi:hypothetical protein